jgi:hypothetical protein
MKIYFEQSGGIVGINYRISINTDFLDADEGLKLQRLIDDARFFHLPSNLGAAPTHGADYFEYKITVVTNDDKKHFVKTTDLTIPSNLGHLIRYLRQKALKAADGNKSPK